MTRSGIHWVSEVRVKEGYEAIFKEHMMRAIEAAEKTEPRTMEFICYISDDGRHCQVDQWYADKKAALQHLDGEVAKLNAELFKIADFVCLWLYAGADEKELVDIFASWGLGDRVVRSSATGGFVRW